METLNSEVHGLNSKLKIFLSRVEGLHILVKQLHHRFLGPIRMPSMVLHLPRKLSNSLHLRKLFPKSNADRDDTVFGVWTIAHMTRVDLLQSKVEHVYPKSDSRVRILALVLHLLR